MYSATISGAALKVRSREAYYAGQKRLFVLVVLLAALAPLLGLSWAALHQASQRKALLIGSVAVLLILVLACVLIRSMMDRVEAADRQRMQLYDRIRYSEKMALIGRMAASVAHEINNPLQIIGDQAGWLDELLAEEEAGALKNREEYREAIVRIKSQIRRASTITHRLLGFSRASEGQRVMTDLNNLVEETISFLEKEARTHRIAISRQTEQNLPQVRTDPPQLQQVFLNIINNAFDAIGQDGTLRIRTGREKGSVFVEFADSGPGLPDELLKKIFEPFFTTKQPGRGTGIGLSISASIVERLGGTIEAENGPDGGGLFRVCLPVGE